MFFDKLRIFHYAQLLVCIYLGIEPFVIDTGSLKMLLIDLKSKALWSETFTGLEGLEVQKFIT